MGFVLITRELTFKMSFLKNAILKRKMVIIVVKIEAYCKKKIE